MSVTKKNPGLSELDELCIQTIRFLSAEAVQKAKSGHPGMPIGMAPAAYVLWTKYMRHNPANPKWHNRDRFVLSAGHGSTLLYSLLHLAGYDISLNELKNFRQWGSKTPGHPEYDPELGVEVTTGPLGQGISNAVGMAIAQKYLANYFNREGFLVIDYKIYVIASDGDLQEGIASEASSLAGHLGLDNLVVVYDDNHISIDGNTELSFTEDRAKRFEAYGWNVQTVKGDGNDMAAFEKALKSSEKEKNRPTLIKLRTHIAFGSPNKQDTSGAHGSPLGDDEIKLMKENYGLKSRLICGKSRRKAPRHRRSGTRCLPITLRRIRNWQGSSVTQQRVSWELILMRFYRSLRREALLRHARLPGRF
jgi:transketolase